MARPKRDAEGISAYERMEDAFWAMLAEMPFEKITISSLSKRARVNHNLIYYYFENIEDMAGQMFRRNMAGDLPQQLLRYLLREEEQEFCQPSHEVLYRIRRTWLFVEKGTTGMQGMVKARLQQEWLQVVGLEREDLTPEDQMELDFVFGGLLAVMGSQTLREHPEAILTFHRRSFGKALAQGVKGLAEQKKLAGK